MYPVGRQQQQVYIISKKKIKNDVSVTIFEFSLRPPINMSMSINIFCLRVDPKRMNQNGTQ